MRTWVRRIPGAQQAARRLDSRISAAVLRGTSPLAERIEELRRDIEEVRAAQEDIVQRLAGVDTRLDVIGDKGEWSAHQLRVLVPQVSALEARTEDLREAGSGRTVENADDLPLDELAEIRREHARIRARFTALSHYEERLRRLEATADTAPDVTAATH